MIQLDGDDLRRTLDPAALGFTTTAEVAPLEGIVGQPRAAEALDLALAIDAPGYNLFATGPPGTGKRSVLEAELRRRAASRSAPPDWVYLFAFGAPMRPIAIALRAGLAPTLAADVAMLVEAARRSLLAAFESESYRDRHRSVHGRARRRRPRHRAWQPPGRGPDAPFHPHAGDRCRRD